MNELIVFYAVDESGQGKIYKELPCRDTYSGKWNGSSDSLLPSIFWRLEYFGFRLPDISWKDNPVTLKITMTCNE